jgi:hypothetical protein
VSVKIPPQINRLLLLTVVIVGSYFAARFFLVPESFGKYGWYRGNALQESAALPITYAGAASCAECHTDVVQEQAKGGHAGIGCESCHGPQKKHAEDASESPTKFAVDRKFCLRCHEANPSRPAGFPQVTDVTHNSIQKCVDCHKPHLPKAKEAK